MEARHRQAQILKDIIDERLRQERLKAEGRFLYSCADHYVGYARGVRRILPAEKVAILGEEFGEVCRAAMELAGHAKDAHSSNPRAALRKELVQVAAVAVAWLEALDSEECGE